MDTPASHPGNADQIAYWNGPGGQRWADRHEVQDVLLSPIADILVDRSRPLRGERVLDVGCGSGAITLALAEKVGPTGHVVGVDISAPMLARARQIAPPGSPIEFVQADATIYPFDPGTFDLLVSRFGLMFFADPVLSFTHMRSALKASARLAFSCWREPRDNPFFMAPLQAVYKHVPKLPPVGPEDPGPFAFASEQRVRTILSESGFSDVVLERCDLALDLATGRGLEAAVEGALQVGPAARALEGHSPELVAAATDSVRETLAAFARGQTVLLPISIWIVTARVT